MPDFTYLPFIIPVTVIIYSGVIAIVLRMYAKQVQRRAQEPSGSVGQPGSFRFVIDCYLASLPFHSTYLSPNAKYPYVGQVILLITRVVSFCLLFGISGLWSYIRADFKNLFYFTLWNVNMISLYYGMASVASIIGLIYHPQLVVKQNGLTSADVNWVCVNGGGEDSRPFWSKHMHRLGFCIQVLYQVAGASALFITVVAFTLLNPAFEFWNVMHHLITSVTFLLEMSQNAMVVRWEHVLLNMLWALIYLVYIWSAVGSREITNWPYDFLKTGSASSFFWYIILFVGNVIFFNLWLFLSRLKYRYVYPDSPTLQQRLGSLLPLDAYYRNGESICACTCGEARVDQVEKDGDGGSSDQVLLESQESPVPHHHLALKASSSTGNNLEESTSSHIEM
mmetsp:Transcript_8004/g.13307  ORF Transcript_8004/g.13307 Transcript_8004/m.13307 type:complete len:394 (+) Transcript_8004:138-1319(+)|eukprot:CAMPEP_0174968540 /NCGR_PEP_ID=MMETSP0004_2-20121128/8193_1 /TAXON_ID=420556 /ORGANISM="Ochromonas sp., Strain CCMP1393" /LENGTH=393 /DNA_ID=CAMNT_0016217789 /DNA_START=106 /DNA_END=1287 /DNA_ORIENTATION=+